MTVRTLNIFLATALFFGVVSLCLHAQPEVPPEEDAAPVPVVVTEPPELGSYWPARCINVVALKRNSFSAEAINCLAEAHRLLYRAKVGLDHAREILRGNNQLAPQVNELLSFVQSQQEGQHGRARERRRAA